MRKEIVPLLIKGYTEDSHKKIYPKFISSAYYSETEPNEITKIQKIYKSRVNGLYGISLEDMNPEKCDDKSRLINFYFCSCFHEYDEIRKNFFPRKVMIVCFRNYSVYQNGVNDILYKIFTAKNHETFYDEIRLYIDSLVYSSKAIVIL